MNIKFNILFLTLIFLHLSFSCSREKDKSKKGNPRPILLKNNVSSNGTMMKLSMYHENYESSEFKVILKISGNKMVFSFPSNGLLAGTEIRVDGEQAVIIDSTTRRKTLVSRNGISKYFGLETAKLQVNIKNLNIKKSDNIKNWSLNLETVSKKLTSFMKLDILETTGKKSYKDLLKFVFLPLNGTIPAELSKLKFPVSWKWTWYKNKEKGSCTWKLMSIESKQFDKNEMIIDVKGYQRVPMNKLVQGFTVNHVVSQNSIQLSLRKKAGVVYLNGKIIDFLVPGNDLHVSLKHGGNFEVYPLFGGPALMNKYLEIPMKWKIN